MGISLSTAPAWAEAHAPLSGREGATNSEQRTMRGTASHLNPAGRMGDILDHPAFDGFARLILPWDGRAYDRAMPLEQIGSLLPYYSHVDPVEVVMDLRRVERPV